MTQKYPEAEPRTAFFPGSFDPFTIGHLDIVKRSLAIFDRVVIGIGVNKAKASGSDIVQRKAAIEAAVCDLDGASVTVFSGLAVSAAQQAGAAVIVRGVRSAADYEYERSMAELNRILSGIDTVILCADPALGAVSSSAVRELQSHGCDVSRFLP